MTTPHTKHYMDLKHLITKMDGLQGAFEHMSRKTVAVANKVHGAAGPGEAADTAHSLLLHADEAAVKAAAGLKIASSTLRQLLPKIGEPGA